MSRTPRVFTIPPSQPFLPTLIDALVGGRLIEDFAPERDPSQLARATLFLPTRRACRAAQETFLEALGTNAAILPRIVPLGDIDEDEIALREMPAEAGAAVLDIAPELGGLERRLLLAKLVHAWARRIAPGVVGETPLVVPTPAAALALADDLARLMDDMTTREVDWSRLDGLVPDGVDEYWQLTLGFLKIAREEWPKLLAERGAIDPARRRDLLISAQIAHFSAHADGPVIAAGSTGSMPATARLIEAISRMPLGAVVLPGLDLDLDDAAWDLIAGKVDDAADGLAPGAYGHYQFALRMLIERLAIARAEVVALASPRALGRETLISEALRPAETTENWPARLDQPDIAKRLGAGFEKLAVVEAATAEEEALAIAIALRETLDEENMTAALVTPDRALARRVLAALGRWGIEADDTAGVALPDTSAGIFARLAAQAALGGIAPVTLLALLKHPRTRLGEPAGALAGAVGALDLLLRGPRPRSGSAALAHTVATLGDQIAKARRGESSSLHRSDPLTGLSEAQCDDARALVDRLAAALAPLEQIAGRRELIGFAEIAKCHRDVVEALSVDADGHIAAFADPDGKALASAFDEIATAPSGDFGLRDGDYQEMFQRVISETIVRRPERSERRVRIYGMLEARLITADRVILGGLNEGVWPPQPRGDPWLSRPMRRKLGLDLPERRIGLSAHDFAQLLGIREVVLCRAAKVGGAPTVPSRFLARLKAIGGERWNAAVKAGATYIDWARGLDHATGVTPVKRPEPKPPLAVRPRALSVTEIEHWLRDPYTIYAKHILKLMRLDAVDTPPGMADRGSAIHGAVGEFTQRFAQALPADPLAELLRIGREHFAPLDDFPEARAFWWPRFERVAHWLSTWESERRAGLAAVAAEKYGTIDIPMGDGTFRLSARADRIERRADGRFAILDFKTGQTPSPKQVRIGVAPQLTLEAAMLRRGGFPTIAATGSIAELLYIRLKGGDPGGEERPIAFKEVTLDDLADQTFARLVGIVARFADPATPYRSLVLPMWKNRYGAYDDLARVKEWSATNASDEADE